MNENNGYLKNWAAKTIARHINVCTRHIREEKSIFVFSMTYH